MSVIYGNPIITNGGGVKLNIDYGSTPPSDTSKLWVPLSGKPDKVECSPALSYGSIYLESITPQVPSGQKTAPSVAAVGEKIYILGGNATGTDISVLDTETMSVSTLSSKLAFSQTWAACQAIGGKIYSLLGSNNGTYGKSQAYDISSDTAAAVASYTSRYMVNSCVSGTDIYISGGINGSGGGYDYPFIKYDTVANSYTTTALNPYTMCGAIAAIGNKVYTFGGSNTDGFSANAFVYDLETGNRTTLANLPYTYGLGYVTAMAVDEDIYIFGGMSGPSYSIHAQTAIYKYSTQNDTYEKVADMANAKCNVRLAKVGTTIYCLGGTNAGGTTGNWFTDIQRLVVSTPLPQNHLFLQGDFGYDGLWSALKSKDTDLKVKVINAYLGDSNNIAQLTNAYLYDTASNQWKSLSGESYVADMQNALNILGVT